MMLENIRAACAAGNIQWRRQALERMMERGISRKQVKTIIMQGEVITLYHDDRPFPSTLIYGSLADEVLHVVVAFDEEASCGYIITAYRPDSEHFEADMKTRRRS